MSCHVCHVTFSIRCHITFSIRCHVTFSIRFHVTFSIVAVFYSLILYFVMFINVSTINMYWTRTIQQLKLTGESFFCEIVISRDSGRWRGGGEIHTGLLKFLTLYLTFTFSFTNYILTL